MTSFEDLNILFEQSFDGAYGFFDKSGAFVSALREELGFMLLNINLTGCELESPDATLRMHASAGHVLLASIGEPPLLQRVDGTHFRLERLG
jgi:hypothetical protein